MADESRNLGSAGGKPGADFTPLFDWIKGEQQHEKTKDLATHNAGLAAKRQEKAHEFSTVMEELRNRHAQERQAQLFEQTTAENMRNNQALLGYTQGLAVDEANRGNVLSSLVQPNAAAMTPEASVPGAGFEPRPIDPRAATAAHTDVVSAIRQRATTEAATRAKLLDAQINRIGADEIAQARHLAPVLRGEGLETAASHLETLTPGAMSKDKFAEMFTGYQTMQENNRARAERMQELGRMRLKIAEANNTAKLEIAKLVQNGKVSAENYRKAQLIKQQIGQQIVSVRANIKLNNDTINAMGTTPAMIKRLQDENLKNQELLDNLMNTQSSIFQIEQVYGQQEPSAPKAAINAKVRTLRHIIDNVIKAKGKQPEDLSPAQQKRLDEEMAKAGYPLKAQ